MIYAINGRRVTAHTDPAAAPADTFIAAQATDLNALPMRRLVELFNVTAPTKLLKRFSSKEQACDRVWAALPELVDRGQGGSLTERYQAKFAGKQLTLKVKRNPRTPQTRAHIIWDQLRSGMSFEEYQQAGGQLHDLLLDIRKERVTLS